MPIINLKTQVNAPIEVVFNLARSIDLHQQSLAHTNEKAIAGRTSGLVKAGETVTWQARHLGITQQLTSLITVVKPHSYFSDELVKGAFKHFEHRHYFKTSSDSTTTMRDEFEYSSPLGILGKLADWIFLEKYMTNLLETRNAALKEVAENGSWKELPEIKDAVIAGTKTV